ncbi:DUF1538 domain-containing protein [Desulfovibrio sp. OttesenSCG-928-I05]|nr:DUF1538 domain-containing protein [Desulfovibrio sp. OttesenSCG-928-I05]
MISNFMAKLKESLVSVLPVMAIVILLHLTIAPLPTGQIPQFIVGGALLILGLSVFLLGADLGMVPFGQRVGSVLTHQRSLPLILAATFAIGFAITIAEPDVQVLANQVNNANPAIEKTPLLIMIAAGVGLFTLIGTARIVFKVPLRWLLIFFYIVVFLVCSFVDPEFVGIAFDSGGATTGPITVPFIMAMGIGVAATTKKKEGDDSSFGLVGLASIGPIAAVAVMGLLARNQPRQEAPEAALAGMESLADAFLGILPHVAQEIFMALFPIVVIFFVFQFTMLKLPAEQLRRMLSGFVYAFIGLVIFMTGVNGGFMGTGQALGVSLGTNNAPWVLIAVGVVLGAVVVCAEPAVWVLTEQVEEVSGGYIRRPIMLAALSLSVAVAVMLGMIRVVTGLSIWWVIIPGYILALGLTKFCPPLFTAIAFDSGGVASGPMATTFVLSLTLGASHAIGGNPATDAFGMIAMIAMAPLITIQFLGLIFKAKERQQMKLAAAKEQETAS